MIDVTQYIEQAIYNCLATPAITYEGATVPVKADFSLAEGLSVHHIIMDNVVASPADTLTNYTSDVAVDIYVVTLPNGYTHIPMNAIASHVCARLQPAFGGVGLTAPTGMQFLNLRVTPKGYTKEWQDGQPILRKMLFLTFQVNHS